MRFDFIIIILVIKGSTDLRSEFSIQTPLRASNRMINKMATLFQLIKHCKCMINSITYSLFPLETCLD